ncbi:MAG: glycosyltransferase family 4 protein [Bryobacteraceae bacterium]
MTAAKINKGEVKKPTTPPLQDTIVLAALSSLELFGHERENIEVFKALKGAGARVIIGVNAISEENNVATEIDRLGFEYFRLPFGNQWSWMWLKRYPFSIVEKISQVWRCSRIFSQQIKKHKPAYIYLGSPLAYSFVAPALWKSRLPLVYRAGDLPPMDSWFNMIIWRSAMRRAFKVASISQFIRSALQRVGGKALDNRIAVIYGTAGHPDPQSTNQTKMDRVVYVGQISVAKGLLQLIDAFAELADVYPEVVLDVIGGSRFTNQFEQQLRHRVVNYGLAKRVIFHGYQSNTDPFLQRSLFQVVPSMCLEALGLVVLEAKAAGIPAVVFPSGGLPEMVRHELDGYVCPAASVSALRDGMKWMLDHKQNLAEMGGAAKEDYQERFSPEIFRRHWVDFFRGMDARASRPER